MIYSQASEYAIRALVYLARGPSCRFVPAKDIAQAEKIPWCFLAKILETLAKKRMLRSSRGRDGGFTLRLDPGEICLLDIVKALDEVVCFEQCAMGHPKCSVKHSCPMHDRWTELRLHIKRYLQRITIAGLASRPDGRRDGDNG